MASMNNFFQRQHLWVINTYSDEGHGLLGILYFGKHQEPEEHMAGFRTATFKTREVARAALREIKSKPYVGICRNARVEKAQIHLETTSQ